MKRSAGVAIIGAGVTGASVACHLARKGVKDILLLDQHEAAGMGSTSRATGGFRVQFGTPVNIALSLLSRNKLLEFSDEFGIDPGFRQCGYLFIAERNEDLEVLKQLLLTQHSAGVTDAREVTVDDILQLNHAVNRERIVGGTFCPSDGFIMPLEILRGYLETAAALGVRTQYNTVITGFRMQEDRITGITTAGGSFDVSIVVNAAGAWAGSVNRMVGVDTRIVPVRRQVAATIPTGVLPDSMPMTIFVEDGFHLRVRDGRVLLLRPDDTFGATPFDTSFDSGWLVGVVNRAHECIPCLREVPVDPMHCWAGLYEMSPDKHALLGRVEPWSNLFLAGGSSGHGVMHAPALGQLLAEIIVTGKAQAMDVHQLRPSRFSEGEAIGGPALL